MLLGILITLTLLSGGTILGFFALQGRVRRWRQVQVHRHAYARWSRLSAERKAQTLKKIGIFPLPSGAADPETLDALFDGVLKTVRELDELDRLLDAEAPSAKGRLAHG
jgi:hypothetical protein